MYFLGCFPKIGKLDVITTYMVVYFTLIYSSCKIGFFLYRVKRIIVLAIQKPSRNKSEGTPSFIRHTTIY